MKTDQFKKKRFIGVGGLLLGLCVVMLSSCLKTKDSNYVNPVSALSVVNSYSGQESVDFYIDGQKVNTQALLYKQNSEYIQIYSGTRRVSITKPGNTNLLADGQVGLNPGKYYSLFLAKKTIASVDSAIGVVTEDTLTAPASGKVKIRFANLSPGSPALDVIRPAEPGTPVFKSLAFKSISGFREVDPADVATLEIHQTGQAANVLGVNLQLQAGKIYTIVATGDWGGTTGTNAFVSQLVTHQ